MSHRIIILFLIAATLFSCREKKTSNTPFPGNDIVGLAIPVRLQIDSTRIDLKDFFENPKAIRSVRFGEQAIVPDSTGMILIAGVTPPPVSVLSVDYNGTVYDIPVFASEKVVHRFTYQATSPEVTEVGISGSMNGWNYKATSLRPVEGKPGAWEVTLPLNPGLYQYRIWENGVEMLDANNPEKMDNGMGGFNNTFYAGEKKGEAPALITHSSSDSEIRIRAEGNVKEVVACFENHRIPAELRNNEIRIAIPEAADTLSRSHIRVYAHDDVQRSNDVLIPLDKGMVISSGAQLSRKDLHGAVMYFMMVDRFYDGSPENNRLTADPGILPMANNMGGDLAGITKKIEDGYFKQLGVNTLWISPVSQNAEGAWGLWNKGVTSTFSAYHGYWPTALRALDDRFGTKEELRDLIKTAHDNGLNVILDYVAHHVHQDHPLFKSKPEWTTSLYLPDGTMNTEKWDEHRLTTWFDTFLPTWDFSKPEVVDALSDTAMYWVTDFELDGFRHDATKHIREEFWRALTYKAKKELRNHPERMLFQIGETYGSAELISSYISSGQMDAQFDFNLYDAAVDAFAKKETDFSNLVRVMNESMNYYGHHHLMGNITGNQDRARFISYADGSVRFDEDPKLAGWTREITNAGSEGFERSKMLMAFLMTAPGIPCVYYGDEIGMPGGNDPDNRRMMIFDQWNEDQSTLQEVTSRLINFRRKSLPLMYGDVFVVKNDADGLVYARHWFEETVLVAFTKRSGDLSVNLPDWMDAGELDQSLLGHSVTHTGPQVTITFETPGAAVITE
jgi:cyclomaltodextrinase / maltogenic alpha-amylase / neopullulanase